MFIWVHLARLGHVPDIISKIFEKLDVKKGKQWLRRCSRVGSFAPVSKRVSYSHWKTHQPADCGSLVPSLNWSKTKGYALYIGICADMGRNTRRAPLFLQTIESLEFWVASAKKITIMTSSEAQFELK